MTGNVCPQCQAPNRNSARFCAECGAPLLSGVSQSRPPAPSGPPPVESGGFEPAVDESYLKPLETGALLEGRYRVVRELGRGGFGAVYRAWDSRLNKAVAVKENLDTSPEAQRQFLREATVLANLSHPNLPRVTDHFIIPNKGQYLVMDFVEGEDLGSLLQRHGNLPIEQSVTWVIQVLDALDYLHNQKPPVLHRDIKPANIKITPAGRAMLVDFGLVKVFDPNMKTTLGARAVTPGYAPPEQYGHGQTDARTDIYALGATLYALITGEEPPESVQRIAGRVMLPANQVNAEISPQITQVITRATSLEPTQRYQSAAEFKKEMQNAMAAPAAVSHEPPQPVQVVSSIPTASPQALERPSAVPVPPLPRSEPVSKPRAAPPIPRSEPISRPRAAEPKRRLALGIGGAVALAVCLVIAALLGLWGYSQQQAIASATGAVVRQATVAARVQQTSDAAARPTLTAQAQATLTAQAAAASTSTKQAQASSTHVPNVATPTGVARTAISPTEQSWSALAASLGLNPSRKLVFGPISGHLTHQVDNLIEDTSASVSLEDFVASIVFINPYAASENAWDYGFTFRHETTNQQYRLVVRSSKAWVLLNNVGKPDGTEIAHGSIPDLDVNKGVSNHILLICKGDRGWFYLNDKLIAELPLSARTNAGDILAGIGYYNGDEVSGEQTEYQDFTVWSLP
jgi:serine/threonine protein kinase